jgi:hypothetical protein
MANNLTGLLPTMYNAMNVVSREMVGLISAVSRDATAQQAGAGVTVRSPVVPTMAAATITPTNIAATGTDQTIGYVDITIDNQRKVSFNLTGEEERGLGQNNGTIMEQRFAQAFRTLANEIEVDLAELYVTASRAYGTAGTAPFGTADDMSAISQVLRILNDNGAPVTDRHIVLGSAAVANLLGKQPAMFRVDAAGNDFARRRGLIQEWFGAEIHHSGQILAHTKGAGTGYDINKTGGYAVGDTSMVVHGGTVNSTGIKAGDVVTLAGDSNNYVVTTGTTSTGATIVLGAPGLRVAGADTTELTIGNSYTANMAFSRDAIQLACRVPAVPSGGDQADDRTIVQDPVSGIAFEVAVYRQYRQVTYEVAACWGVKAVKPAHLAILMG